jgi:hypothetical protein
MHHSIFLCSNFDNDMIRSISAPNHALIFTHSNDVVLVHNPTLNGINCSVYRMINSRICYIFDQISKIENWSFENMTFDKAVKIFSRIKHKYFPSSNCNIRDKQLLNKLELKVHNHLLDTHNIFKTLKEQIFFYEILTKLKPVFKPIAMYELFILSDPQNLKEFYGMPLHCQNLVSNIAKLDIGSNLSIVDLEQKLLKYNGQKNFLCYNLYKRNLTEEECTLGGGGDSGADQAQVALNQQEYAQQQQQLQEQTTNLDKMQMNFLHAQGGLAYQQPNTTPTGVVT